MLYFQGSIFIVINRGHSGALSPVEEEIVVLEGPSLLFAPGIHLQNVTGQKIRKALFDVCACEYVYTHMCRHVCLLWARVGEGEVRISAKEPGANTAGFLRKSHFPSY